MPTSYQDAALPGSGNVCLWGICFCPEVVYVLRGIQDKVSLTLLSYPVQLRSIPVKGAEDDELEEEADWIDQKTVTQLENRGASSSSGWALAESLRGQ